MHLVYCDDACARGGMLEIGDGCELGVTTLIVMLNFIVAMLRSLLKLLGTLFCSFTRLHRFNRLPFV